MPMYRSAMLDEIEHEDEQLESDVPVITEELSVEEKTFAKRYADLRRFQQQEAAQLKARIKELEGNVGTAARDALTLPDENDKKAIEAWIAAHPQIARVVTGIAQVQAHQATDNINTRLAEITQREADLRQQQAIAKIKDAHPDFDDLSNSEEFHEWLGTKSQTMQDAIYVNSDDWRAASDVLALFKAQNVKTTPIVQPNAKDVAGRVRTQPIASAPRGRDGYKFSESQINSMGDVEWERNEEAIMTAWRENKVLRDLTGGAN